MRASAGRLLQKCWCILLYLADISRPASSACSGARRQLASGKKPFFYWKSPLPLNRPTAWPASAKYSLPIGVQQAVRRAPGPNPLPSARPFGQETLHAVPSMTSGTLRHETCRCQQLSATCARRPPSSVPSSRIMCAVCWQGLPKLYIPKGSQVHKFNNLQKKWRPHSFNRGRAT